MNFLGRVGAQLRRPARAILDASQRRGQSVARVPAAERGGTADAPRRSPGPRARIARPSASVRLTNRRVPDGRSAVERNDAVPRWIRTYGTTAWLLIGIVIVVGMIVFATSRIQAVFIAVFLAAVVTSVLYPIVSLLARYMPRVLAAVITLLGGFAIVAGLMTYIVTSVIGQWSTLAEQFGDGINAIFEFLEEGPLPINITQAEVANWINSLLDEAQDYISQNAGELASTVLSNAGAVALIFTVIALSLFVTIFFLIRGGDMWLWFLNQLPARYRSNVHRAADAGWTTFSGYARGTMIIALFDGVLAFLLLIIVGVPLAAPLAVLVFIGAFIPLIGAPAAMIIAAVVALAANGFVAAIVVTIGIALIGQIEGNVLQPLVMGRQVSLHPVIVALGVTAGTFLAGLLGAIIVIPIMAVIWAVYSELRTLDPPIEGPLPRSSRVSKRGA
ncbi:MAG TPA: AI-2E family transporter [Actinomycetaceae bacterium]|nr:AI-2E family transporter [Actinomycetaceae bacterium]